MIINNSYVNNSRKIIEQKSESVKNKLINNKGEFGDILKEKISESSEVKFSKHAELRLNMRNINLSALQKKKLENAVSMAREKGIKDSLVMVDNVALVVNVKSKTVITAVSSSELKDNVFTNIDGAVFA